MLLSCSGGGAIARGGGGAQRRCRRRAAATTVAAARNSQQSAQQQPPPTEEERAADQALQSAVESGIRGSLAAAVAWCLHAHPLTAALHAPSAAELGAAAQAALPLIMFDAALLLPTLNGRVAGNGDATTAGLAVDAAARALAQAQAHCRRYSLSAVRPLPAALALEAAAQASEELLARGVLFSVGSAWLRGRLLEAGVIAAAGGGVDDLLPSAVATPGGDAAEWLMLAAIVAAIVSRYAGHARRAVVERRGARAAAAVTRDARARLLRFEPLAVQQAAAALAAAAKEEEEEAGGVGGGVVDDAAAAALHLVLGARFVAGQAALYGVFMTTHNLGASFATGLAVLAASTALCRRRDRLERGGGGGM